MAGSDEAGDKTVEHGVKIWNGTAFVDAQFGVAPLNGGDSGLGYNNNAAVHFANNAIRSGVAGEVRILPNWLPGDTIASWVGSGTSSARFAELTAMLAAAGVTQVHAFLWMQGERDSTTEATGYNTLALYETGFEALKAQLRAQPWFPATTPIIAQELGGWYENNSNARNDYWQKVDRGDDPYVAVSSAAGLTMGTGSGDAAHFSGGSLATIGRRMWAAWLNLRLGMGQKAGLRTPEGFSVSRPRQIVATNTTVSLGVDDLRNGAFVEAANATVNFPLASYLPGAEVTINVWSVSSSVTTLSGLQAFGDVPWQADATTVGLGLGTYVFRSIRGRWRYVSTSNASYGLRQAGTITISGSYSMTAQECGDNSWIVAGGGTLVLPNPNGVAAQRSVALRFSADTLLDVAAGGIIAGQGVPAFPGQAILVPADNIIVLRPTESARWAIVGGTFRLGRKAILAKAAAYSTTRLDLGTVITNAGATARVDVSLPPAEAGLEFEFVVDDADGLRIVASSASGDRIRRGATLTATGGYVESTTAGSTLRLVCLDNTTWQVMSETGSWATN